MDLITQYLGRHLLVLDVVESTNDFALEYIRQTPNFINGTVVLANEQTKGRGQRGNIWKSEPDKSLTFSIIQKLVNLNNDSIFLLNKAVSVGIIKGLLELCKTEEEKSLLKIKWPNDIFYKDKKLGGILIENQWKGLALKSSIIGIGLNVCALTEAPGGSISFEEIVGYAIDKKVVFNTVLNEIEIQFSIMQKNALVIEKEFDDFLFGKEIALNYTYLGNKINGVVIKADNKGNLILNSDNKTIIANHSELNLNRE